ATQEGDCDDSDPDVNPGMEEVCDNEKDDDCDGLVDENDPDCEGPECTNFYWDEDGDNYGTSDFVCALSATSSYTATQDGDCDDTKPLVYPGAAEVCDNDIDDDCDGLVDEEDPDCEDGGGVGGGGIAFFSLRIFNEETLRRGSTSMTVSWFTNTPATSRVIYDTAPHSASELGDPPNYGYAFSTEEDSTKVTYHEMTITGLTPGATYYWRPVSHGSGEVVGEENAVVTEELPCVEQGGSIPVIQYPPECCEGLELIPPRSANIVGSYGICTALCGNGVCNVVTESAYNCPEDCEVVSPPPVGEQEEEEEETPPPVGEQEEEEEETPPEEGTTTPGEIPGEGATPAEATPTEEEGEGGIVDTALNFLASMVAMVSQVFGGTVATCLPWWTMVFLFIYSAGNSLRAWRKEKKEKIVWIIWSLIVIALTVYIYFEVCPCLTLWSFIVLAGVTLLIRWFVLRKDEE
ncbi:MAG: hypothetical protein GF370_03610, partial [Candidatus Nealsonbacteria bacterium]|nr:hypothetical protein [Candidatus Nealsonbacteria bacterium]